MLSAGLTSQLKAIRPPARASLYRTGFFLSVNLMVVELVQSLFRVCCFCCSTVVVVVDFRGTKKNEKKERRKE